VGDKFFGFITVCLINLHYMLLLWLLLGFTGINLLNLIILAWCGCASYSANNILKEKCDCARQLFLSLLLLSFAGNIQPYLANPVLLLHGTEDQHQ